MSNIKKRKEITKKLSNKLNDYWDSDYFQNKKIKDNQIASGKIPIYNYIINEGIIDFEERIIATDEKDAIEKYNLIHKDKKAILIRKIEK